MEGRPGPFMGWPAKKSDKEIKEGELAELKKKVAALEKELRVSSLPSLAHEIIRDLSISLPGHPPRSRAEAGFPRLAHLVFWDYPPHPRLGLKL
jgi:hypothetical protein